MTTHSPQANDATHSSLAKDQDWKTLYAAALFEEDRAKIPALVAQAESEIVQRTRMLFYDSAHNQGEMRALTNALNMLQLLKNCLKIAPAERVSVC